MILRHNENLLRVQQVVMATVWQILDIPCGNWMSEGSKEVIQVKLQLQQNL